MLRAYQLLEPSIFVVASPPPETAKVELNKVS